MNKYYYTGVCIDGGKTDPTQEFVGKYNEGEPRIFFGNKKSVIMVSADKAPEVTEPEFVSKTEAELYDITDPDIINYGFNAEDFINPPTPPHGDN